MIDSGIATAVSNEVSARNVEKFSGFSFCAVEIDPHAPYGHAEHGNADSEKGEVIPGDNRQNPCLHNLEQQRRHGDEEYPEQEGVALWCC